MVTLGGLVVVEQPLHGGGRHARGGRGRRGLLRAEGELAGPLVGRRHRRHRRHGRALAHRAHVAHVVHGVRAERLPGVPRILYYYLLANYPRLPLLRCVPKVKL